MNNLEFIGCQMYKKGSGIHIKKKNRGKFTASAKKAGRSVQEHARAVLKNPKATPLQKKRANFARNAAKWKHEDGSKIHKPDGHRSILDNGWIPTKRLKKGTYGLIKKHRSGDKLEKPSRNWDNTLVGKLINYAENRDSIGFDREKQRWYAPPSGKGYDTNQFGMGVDRNKTEGFKKYVKKDNKGKEYLTVKDERYLRHMKIDQANESANQRYKYAQKATNNPNGSISPINDALTISAIYNLGQGHVANTLFEDKNAMRALFKRDLSYMPFVHGEYKKKNRNERIKLEKKFLKSKR